MVGAWINFHALFLLQKEVVLVANNELLNVLEVFKANGKFEEWLACIVRIYEKDGDMKATKERLADFRRSLLASTCEDKTELMKKSYGCIARDDFDAFMIYIEWDRPTKEKFWLPRRKKLMHICEALQELEDGVLEELFISQPPRTGKSTIVMFFLLWTMLRNSEKSNLYSSYSDTVAKVYYNGILEILGDTTTYLWRDIFPDSKVVSTNSQDLMLNLDRHKRYPSFTARSLYGTLNGACDCNGYLIADDLHSGIEEALNPDRLRSAWSKVENNLLPRAKEKAKILWIGTRWSQMDCIARRIDTLENESEFKKRKWKEINIPALDENDESNFEYEYNVGFSTEYYRQRRASFERNDDIASWLAQYMGTPIERDGSVFSPENLRFYNGDLPEGTPDRIFMAVDPAWGGGDYVAAPICFQYGEDIFVHDVVFNNEDKAVTQPLVAYMAAKYRAGAMKIEATKMTKSYGEGVDEQLKKLKYRLNLMMNTSHFTGTGKAQRIFDKAPDIREHMIFRAVGHRSKEYEAFMNNVFAFKVVGKVKHDDAPDSLAMAIDMAFFSVANIEIRKRII